MASHVSFQSFTQREKPSFLAGVLEPFLPPPRRLPTSFPQMPPPLVHTKLVGLRGADTPHSIHPTVDRREEAGSRGRVKRWHLAWGCATSWKGNPGALPGREAGCGQPGSLGGQEDTSQLWPEGMMRGFL